MPSDLFSPVDDLSGAGISENCEMVTFSGNTAYSLKGCFTELDNEKEAP